MVRGQKWDTHTLLVAMVVGLREADTVVPVQVDNTTHTPALDLGYTAVLVLATTDGTEAIECLVYHHDHLSSPIVMACNTSCNLSVATVNIVAGVAFIKIKDTISSDVLAPHTKNCHSDL